MSIYILHAKFKKLLGEIEGVKAYIDDILFLNKSTFWDHVEQLRIFLMHLKGQFENQCQYMQLRIKGDSLSWIRHNKGRSQSRPQ